jgi:hypothetical protein
MDEPKVGRKRVPELGEITVVRAGPGPRASERADVYLGWRSILAKQPGRQAGGGTMVTISRGQVKHAVELEYFEKLHVLRERIQLFEGKYKCTLAALEMRVNGGGEEVFEEWDDYLEWSGYAQALGETEAQLREIAGEHFVVA